MKKTVISETGKMYNGFLSLLFLSFPVNFLLLSFSTRIFSTLMWKRKANSFEQFFLPLYMSISPSLLSNIYTSSFFHHSEFKIQPTHDRYKSPTSPVFLTVPNFRETTNSIQAILNFFMWAQKLFIEFLVFLPTHEMVPKYKLV